MFLPPGIRAVDVHPRSRGSKWVRNGPAGCYCAGDRTFELFEGGFACLHSDPLSNGLKPADTKRLRLRLYLLPNDIQSLQQAYRRDFPAVAAEWTKTGAAMIPRKP